LLSDELAALARSAVRQGLKFLVIEAERLEGWARENQLSPAQAWEQALLAGIFPENLERNFPTLSVQDQLQVYRSRVLVVGLGGLGGYQAMFLARLGVGHLLLADGDSFAPANLNRQILATMATLGQPKARATAGFLASINPALKIQPLGEYLQASDYATHLPQIDLVLDALDSLGARRELLAAARQAGKPVIHGAVLGHDGQVTTILPGDGPAFASKYLSAAISTPESPAVLAPIVAIVAGLQVQEAVRLLLNRPLAYHGRLAYLDGDTGRLEFFPL
jgi:molybdopterin/thiamine biosynthesis adenylyltransferase